jgi:hypothetical protein
LAEKIEQASQDTILKYGEQWRSLSVEELLRRQEMILSLISHTSSKIEFVQEPITEYMAQKLVELATIQKVLREKISIPADGKFLKLL